MTLPTLLSNIIRSTPKEGVSWSIVFDQIIYVCDQQLSQGNARSFHWLVDKNCEPSAWQFVRNPHVRMDDPEHVDRLFACKGFMFLYISSFFPEDMAHLPNAERYITARRVSSVVRLDKDDTTLRTRTWREKYGNDKDGLKENPAFTMDFVIRTMDKFRWGVNDLLTTTALHFTRDDLKHFRANVDLDPRVWANPDIASAKDIAERFLRIQFKNTTVSFNAWTMTKAYPWMVQNPNCSLGLALENAKKYPGEDDITVAFLRHVDFDADALLEALRGVDNDYKTFRDYILQHPMTTLQLIQDRVTPGLLEFLGDGGTLHSVKQMPMTITLGAKNEFIGIDGALQQVRYKRRIEVEVPTSQAPPEGVVFDEDDDVVIINATTQS